MNVELLTLQNDVLLIFLFLFFLWEKQTTMGHAVQLLTRMHWYNNQGAQRGGLHLPSQLQLANQ